MTFPDGSTGTRTQSPAVAPTEDVGIDTAVVYEREG